VVSAPSFRGLCLDQVFSDELRADTGLAGSSTLL